MPHITEIMHVNFEIDLGVSIAATVCEAEDMTRSEVIDEAARWVQMVLGVDPRPLPATVHNVLDQKIEEN